MKKTTLIIPVLALPLLASAQVNIKSPEDFTVGTHLTFKECDPGSFDPGLTGTKQTWDFSKLSGTKDAEETIIAPDKAPDGSKFPKANQVEKNSDGSYVYVDKEANNSFMVGYVSGNMVITYAKPLTFAKRPSNYGGTNTYPFTDTYTVNGLTFNGTGTVSIMADACGTLILPDKKKYSDVLRIKITIKQKDVAGTTTNNTTVTTYVWFDDKHKSALLKMSTTNSGSYNSKTLEYLVSEEDK